jgi:hypothetical protein
LSDAAASPPDFGAARGFAPVTAAGVSGLASERFGIGQQGLYQGKLLVRKVACVTLADYRIFSPIGLVPGHGESLVLLQSQRIVVVGSDQPRNARIRDSMPAEPFIAISFSVRLSPHEF